MSEPVDPFERRLAERLSALSETPLPGRTPQHVVDAVSSAGEARPWRLALLGAAALVTAVATSVVLGGGGPTGPATTSTSASPGLPDGCDGLGPDDPSRFVELLRVVTYDYEPHNTPWAQAQAADLVVLGCIDDVRAEPSARDLPRMGGATIVVSVSQVVAGDKSLVADGKVYVRVPVQEDVGALRGAIPSGQVLLFLSRASTGEVSVFTPFVQGFWIEGPQRAIGVYEDIGNQPDGWAGLTTIDALVGAIEPRPVQAADLRYTCGDEHSFAPSLFDEPEVDLRTTPAGLALAEFIGSGQAGRLLPASGWHLAGQDETRATFVAAANEAPTASAELVLEGGRWDVRGWGGCNAVLAAEGRNPATWTFVDEQAVGPTSTSFLVEVTETSCAGGKSSKDRLHPPLISYAMDRVIVAFTVEPLPGAHLCPANSPARVRVELSEPLGNRQLLDGGALPWRDPANPY